MLSLLKAGAFDSFGERTELVENYIRKISKPKESNLTKLKNVNRIRLNTRRVRYAVKGI